MRTHTFATFAAAFAAALALLTTSWVPGTADARGIVVPDGPEIEFTEDLDETSLLTVRNGIALSGLVRAALADGDRTVTVVTDDAVVYEVTFDADGEYTQVLNHGGVPGSEWEVAAAVAEFDRGDGYEAVLAGDQGPLVDLELDIEGRTRGEIIGMTDVIAGPDYLDMIVVIDPTAIGLDLDWIINVILPEIIHGPCDPEGYPGELCDLLGDKTGCACNDMVDPETGESNSSGVADPDQVDFFDWLWNAWNSLTGKKDKTKSTDNGDDEGDDDDDALTDPDDIAPWTEGPMLLMDQLDVLIVNQTWITGSSPLDGLQFGL